MAFRHKKRALKTDRGGFTLVEVMVASGLALLLTLAIFESVLYCNRLAYDVKSRLAADAIAFDTVWEMFNRQLEWFDGQVFATSSWTSLDTENYDAWGVNGSQVFVFSAVIPQGLPPTNWLLRANVEWPDLSGGGVKTLPRDYEVIRARTQRNVFRPTR